MNRIMLMNKTLQAIRKEEINKVICQAIEYCTGESVTSLNDDDTIESLGIDSLDVLEIAIEIEDRLSIDIPDDDLEKCKTASDLINLIESLAS